MVDKDGLGEFVPVLDLGIGFVEIGDEILDC